MNMSHVTIVTITRRWTSNLASMILQAKSLLCGSHRYEILYHLMCTLINSWQALFCILQSYIYSLLINTHSNYYYYYWMGKDVLARQFAKLGHRPLRMPISWLVSKIIKTLRKFSYFRCQQNWVGEFKRLTTLLVKKCCLISNVKRSLNNLNWCPLVVDELLMVKKTDVE